MKLEEVERLASVPEIKGGLFRLNQQPAWMRPIWRRSWLERAYVLWGRWQRHPHIVSESGASQCYAWSFEDFVATDWELAPPAIQKLYDENYA